jgi:hypothetical protein
MSTARQRSIASHPGENDRLVSRFLISMPYVRAKIATPIQRVNAIAEPARAR